MATLPLQIRNTEPDDRYGFCRCGCGQAAPVPKYSDVSKGWIGGKPLPYCNGHTTRRYKRYEVDPVTGCWNWLIGFNPNGYGIVRMNNRTYSVYALMYRILRGKVPAGLELDHLCRNRRCINPDHLEPVTHMVNNQRGRTAKLTVKQVAEIRILLANGYTHRKIAPMFSVSKSAITSINKGRCWRNH